MTNGTRRRELLRCALLASPRSRVSHALSTGLLPLSGQPARARLTHLLRSRRRTGDRHTAQTTASGVSRHSRALGVQAVGESHGASMATKHNATRACAKFSRCDALGGERYALDGEGAAVSSA